MGRVAVVTGGASGIGLAADVSDRAAAEKALDGARAEFGPFAQGPGGEEMIKQMAARSPVRRLGLPEDIAATTAFLCSDDAGYITGQVIGVNGGNYT